MKLASLKHGRDGRLVVVSTDLAWYADAGNIAPTLQAALDDWDRIAPDLRNLQTDLDHEVIWRVSRGHDPDPASVERGWLDRIPMGRYQQPEHIARTILFLASDEAGETTGECVNVSGGAVME